MAALKTISTHPTNGTAIAEVYRPVPNEPLTYFMGILFLFLLLVGMLGNGTLILIIVRHRHMRSVTNAYLISLALSDLLLILTSLFTSIVYTLGSWPFGNFICRVWETAKDLSMGVSVFTLTALSAERYCAISNPIRHHISSKQLTVVITATLWLVATLIALPSAILSHLRHQSEFWYCYPFSENLRVRQGVVLLKFLTHYLIPLISIACFYVQMAKRLERTTRNIPGELPGQTVQMRTRKKVAKMVQLLAFVFMICFLPHHVFMLLFHLWPDAQSNIRFSHFLEAFRNFAFCFSFINSCINPIVLYFFSSAFRTHFDYYLRMWKCSSCRKPHSDTTPVRAPVVCHADALIPSSSTTSPSKISSVATTSED